MGEYSLKNQTVSSWAKLRNIFAILFLLWITNGCLSYLFYYIPVAIKMSFFLMWLLMAVAGNRLFIGEVVKKEAWLLLFIVILIGVNLFSNVDVSYYLKTSVYFTGLYAIFLFYKERDLREIKTIVYPVLIDYLFIIVNTIIKLTQNPNLARYLSHDDEDIIALFGASANLGVGNYTFAYSLVVVAFLVFYLTLSSKKKLLPKICIIALLIFTLIKMSFTLSILLMIVCCVYEIVLASPKTNLKAIWVLIIAIGIPIVIINIEYFANLFPGAIGEKIMQITAFIAGNESAYGKELYARLDKYQNSINTILAYPLLGSLSGGLVGGHSTWLDFYAKMGIFSLPIYIFAVKAVATIKRVHKHLGSTLAVYWLLLGMLNTAYAPRLLLTFFVIYPLMAKLVGTRTKVKS